MIETNDLVAGWRGLAVAVGERLGRPVGASRIRWAVDSSGLAIGAKIGGILIFDRADVETVSHLVEDANKRAASRGIGDPI